MREIKFRAMWQGKWFYFTLDELANAATVGPVGRSVLIIHLGESKNRCQYTGLKDKSGVEIYEGDIVSYMENVADGHFLEAKIQVEIGPDGVNFCWWYEGVEVIGNIYEHGYLLD